MALFKLKILLKGSIICFTFLERLGKTPSPLIFSRARFGVLNMSKLFLVLLAIFLLPLAGPDLVFGQVGEINPSLVKPEENSVPNPPLEKRQPPLSEQGKSDMVAEEQAATEPQAELAPKVTFDSMEFDGGTSPAGTTISHDFKITNSGTDALLIFDVVPGCGCTVTSFDKFIPPGKSGKITVNVDLYREWAGQEYYKAVTVITNDPEYPRLRLLMKGKIAAPAGGRPLNRVTPGQDSVDSPES